MPTLAAGSSVTATLTDGGVLSLSSNSGEATVTVTPTAGAVQTFTLGPRPTRRSVGPLSEGGTVLIVSSTAEVIYECQSGCPASALTSDQVAATQALVSGAGNNTAVVVGDSIARCQGVALDMMSFMEYAALSSNGAMRLIGNFGVNGAKTADIITSQLPLALATSAAFVFVMEVANDALNSVPVATHRANMQIIISAIRAAGKTPVIVGAPPVNGFNVWQYNAADQQLAMANGVRFVQPWAASASNGAWRDSTYSFDGVHPYAKASRLAGAALWAAVDPMFVGTADLAWSDENGMLSNCLNLTNVSGVPTGWTGAAGVTHSCSEAGTGEAAGNWWKQTATGITSWQISGRAGVSLPANWLAADVVRMSARIRSVGFEANGGKADAAYASQGNMGGYLALSWTGGSLGGLTLRECDADISGVVSVDGVIPTGATGANFSNAIVAFGTVSGEWSVAQWQVHNLSLAARLA